MKTRIFFVLAAIGLLASCAKEQAPQNDNVLPGGPDASRVLTTLTVGLPNPDALAPQYTRTHMDPTAQAGKHKVYWSDGDQIAVNGVASQELSDVAEGTQAATFNFEAVLETPYRIVYPASISSQTGESVTLPERQTYKADGFAEGMYPMAGYSADGEGITLNPLCAMLKISVKRAVGEGADADDLVAVRFKGKNNEQVCGSFTIDYENATLTGTSSAAADKEVKVVKVQATSVETAAVYYIVVPAGTYSNGFDITVQDNKGHIMTQSKASSVELTSGALYVMPEFTFVPTATELGVEIASAEDLISFATNYNNKVYDALGDALIATLTADITFDTTSSAAFNATGGIGVRKGVDGATEDYYFNGVFNGENHTISGLAATVPVFAFTDTGCVINDLTLDNTCSLTINSPVTRNVHAPLIGRNKGAVNNCMCDADVTINNLQDVSSSEQHYGGLIGRNYGGTVSGCAVSGTISCTQTEIAITTNNVFIGGVAGSQGDTGSISNCDFTGNITISDGTDFGGISAAKLYFYMGGVVGYADGTGSISYCNDSAPSGTPGSIDARGTFVPGIGGVVGWVESTSCTVSHCNNYMSLSFKSNGARSNTTPCRVGGIAGRSKGDVSECDNNGPIATVCNSTSIYLGGILGDGRNIYHCNNNSAGTITRTNQLEVTSDQSNRYHYIGGIAGGNLSPATIEDCHNFAKILNNTPGVATNTTIDMGGIIGYVGPTSAETVNKATISACSNGGEVVLDNKVTTAVAIARTTLGGIVGYVDVGGAQTKVSSSSNTGKIWCNNDATASYGPMCIGGTIGKTAAVSSIEDCSNGGAILCSGVGVNSKATVDLGGIVGWASATISISGTKPADSQQYTQNSGAIDVTDAGSTVYARTSLGGIIGFGNGANSTFTYCKNTAQVHCTYTTSGADRRSYIGGIAGVMASLTYNSDGTPKSFGALNGTDIGNCVNTGVVWTQNYNNSTGNKSSAFAGGIIGAIAGNTGDNNASIHDCTSSTGNLTNYRGCVGGIAAYISYTSLSKNTASQTISGNNNALAAAGIVGMATNSSSISDCTFSGSVGAVKNIGGICYSLDATSSISGCKVNGATITKGTNAAATEPAVLVSIAANGSSITDCGVKGTLKGAAITLESKMVTTNNGATITGTYLIE